MLPKQYLGAAAIAFAGLFNGSDNAAAESLDWKWCGAGKSADISRELQLEGCTNIISSGSESTRNLAIALTNRCIIYRAMGELDDAVKDCDRATRVDPSYANALSVRCFMKFNSGDFEGALADCNRAIATDGRHIDGYLGRSLIYRNREQYDLALGNVNRAIRIEPDSSFAYRERGDVYEQQDKNAEALRDYSKAIRLQPRDADVYSRRAFVYSKLKNYDHAVDDYSEAIRLDPKSASHYESRAHVYLSKKDYSRAIADYSVAIRLAPSEINYHAGLARAYMDSNDLARALSKCDEIISRWPDNDFGYLLRSEIYTSNGEFDRALLELDQAAKRSSPGLDFVSIRRGFIYYKRGEWTKAVDSFEAALASPDFNPIKYQFMNKPKAEALYGRSLARRKNGDQALANADLEAARNLNKDVEKNTNESYGLSPVATPATAHVPPTVRPPGASFPATHPVTSLIPPGSNEDASTASHIFPTTAPLLGPPLLGAAAAQSRPSMSQTARRLAADSTYLPWIKVCPTTNNCKISSIVYYKGNRIGEISVNPLTGSVSLYIPSVEPALSGVGRARLDGKDIAATDIRTCDKAGCFAAFKLSVTQLRALSAGRVLSVELSDANEIRLAFNIPLSNFKILYE